MKKLIFGLLIGSALVIPAMVYAESDTIQVTATVPDHSLKVVNNYGEQVAPDGGIQPAAGSKDLEGGLTLK